MSEKHEMTKSTMLDAIGHLYYGLLVLHEPDSVELFLAKYIDKWNTNRPFEKISNEEIEDTLRELSFHDQKQLH